VTAAARTALTILDDRVLAPERTAVVLMNVGTPDAPSTSAVRRYLCEFLSDPRVLDMNAVARWFLLRLVILPCRSPKSASMYRTIWTERGSPLLVHSLDLATKLRARVAPHDEVLVGMRYGAPRLADAVDEIRRGGFSRVVLVPLFPQYASASTGTALAEAYRLLGALPRVPDVSVVPPFFLDAGFVAAVSLTIREVTQSQHARGTPFDHLLFSYHSIPVHHVTQIHATCANSDACCATLGAHNADCYRAQCTATTAAVMRVLGRETSTSLPFSTSFQSRLGRAAWLTPNTEHALVELARKGVKRLAIVCPSFVADCLETLEEIGVRARAQFLAAGGEELTAIPCVNATEPFADAVATLVRGARGASNGTGSNHAQR
jgi:ferrochelatase